MSDQSAPSRRDAVRKLILITMGCVGFFSLAIVATLAVKDDSDPDLGAVVIRAGIALVTVVLFISIVTDIFSREDPEIVRIRQRVQQAEDSVEGALRGDASGDSRARVPAQTVSWGVGDETGTVMTVPLPSEDRATAQERRDLALSTLWTLTQTRLDLYHRIATTQARRSFGTAQASMIAGFVMLAVFVGLALKVSNTTGAIVAGGLGAVSAALAGYISKTFVKSQQTAAEHLKAYFDQPLEFSRYLAAERVLTDANLPEEKRAEVVAALVQTIAAGPAGAAPGDMKGLLEQLQDLAPGQ
ncbi:hypothetical protein ELQ39_00055 [Streptomyces sp. GB4-14]|uniref:TRADD-N-associated membrane domain-containing protein n=1 Tax=Streptomyces sp. GB4-14 TaxID=2498703 RepID=UPI001F5CE1BE|nr:hypothetical protein [Streptomyces sp. GB4-14]